MSSSGSYPEDRRFKSCSRYQILEGFFAFPFQIERLGSVSGWASRPLTTNKEKIYDTRKILSLPQRYRL